MFIFLTSVCHKTDYSFFFCLQFILCFICIGMITFEVMLAHMFTQMLIVVVQDALLLVFTLIVFGVSMVQNRV